MISSMFHCMIAAKDNSSIGFVSHSVGGNKRRKQRTIVHTIPILRPPAVGTPLFALEQGQSPFPLRSRARCIAARGNFRAIASESQASETVTHQKFEIRGPVHRLCTDQGQA